MSKQGTLPKDQAKLRARAGAALWSAADTADYGFAQVTRNHPGHALQRLRAARKYLDAAEAALSEWQTLRAKGEPQEFTE